MLPWGGEWDYLNNMRFFGGPAILGGGLKTRSFASHGHPWFALIGTSPLFSCLLVAWVSGKGAAA